MNVEQQRLILCAITSMAGHLALARGLQHLPPLADQPLPPLVAIRIVDTTPPEPPPEPEPPAPPKPPEPPEPPLHERVRVQPMQATRHDRAVEVAANQPAQTPDPTVQPVFGVTMESTSQASNGLELPIGNTTRHAGPAIEAVRPLGAPVAAIEVTKMPMPQGRCTGKYTAEAHAAAIEGVVVLDLTVDEQGRAQDIGVVAGLSHGLTQAAIAALQACSFTPGEKNGKPVSVRVRNFKIRFLMPEAR
jgi:TonB family protein